MIKIDRSRVTAPQILNSKEVKDRLAEASSFYGQPAEKRRQQRFRLDLKFAMRTLTPALEVLFNGKCAYCERTLEPITKFPNYDHFRPTGATIGADGTVFVDHYWWLAYEWKNLFSCCLECNRSKADHFPVQHRAPLRTPWDKLIAEKAVLIDPTRDDPEKHLIFSIDGRVAGRTDRGTRTIALLNLNRPQLVALREATSEEILQQIGRIKNMSNPARSSATGKLCGADKPFSALRRQLIDEALNTSKGRAAKRSIGDALKNQDSAEKRRQRVSVEEKKIDPEFFLGSRYVREIRIHNFFSLKDVHIKINKATTAAAPWTVLLGENGVGKSSVLKAIALALGGNAYRQRLRISPKDILGPIAKDGYVHIQLDGLQRPIELTYSRGEKNLESNSPRAMVHLLAYGATRLLPTFEQQARKQARYARLNNLFDPSAPLLDSGRWLKSLKPERFDYVCRGLRDLLELPHGAVFRRRIESGAEIRLHANGPYLPINRLSDGYQSMLALATDMISVLGEIWSVMEAAQGVVLLDELGTHLHPTWRMRMVSRLRETFPRVQFIASTHDPLCLRGLNDGEVILLRKDAKGMLDVVDELPSIQGLRVDQILTSSYFGLHSTIGPELESAFNRYYELLARRTPSPKRRKELTDLRRDLARYEILGTTRRERMMYRAIDEYLANEPTIIEPIDVDSIPEQLKPLFDDLAALASGGTRGRRQ